MVGADHGERGGRFVSREGREDRRGKVDGDADPFLEVEEIIERFGDASRLGQIVEHVLFVASC